jgi:3-deoxy-D-manno-octulosonic-acid transferase
VLLLAPRHVERAVQLEAAVKAAGLSVVRRSSLREHGDGLPPVGASEVVILDTRGELASVYRHAALCFVGGTLVPIGGHNLLEPARWGKAVFFGPHTDHCAEVAALLLQAGGGVRVRDGMELATEMAKLLRDRETLYRMGEAARAVVVENQGAVARTLELIGRVLEGRGQNDDGVAQHVVPYLRGSERRTMHAE